MDGRGRDLPFKPLFGLISRLQADTVAALWGKPGGTLNRIPGIVISPRTPPTALHRALPLDLRRN